MIVMSGFLQNLNPITSSLNSGPFIFIVSQELWNDIQLNLSVTFFHDMTL